MSQKAVIREAELSDAASIAQIYNAYIQTSTITFEEEAVTPEEMARRIGDVRAGGLPWYLSIAEGEVAGYAYAIRWRPRSAYGLSVEVTVYVAQAYTGRGIGTDLYERVLGMLKERGFHTAIAGIALPNLKSITLHQRFGFVKVAHFSQVGFKLGRWVDVGYWQLML